MPRRQQRVLDHRLPAGLGGGAEVGGPVRAWVGPRRISGFLVSIREGGAGSRPLKTLDDAAPPLWGEEMVDLARWMSKQYCAPIGQC